MGRSDNHNDIDIVELVCIAKSQEFQPSINQTITICKLHPYVACVCLSAFMLFWQNIIIRCIMYNPPWP